MPRKPPSEDREIADRIVEARTVRNIGSNELDRLLGKHPGWTANTAKRGSRPRGDTLEKIASVLGVSLEWLITGRGQAPKFSERWTPTVPRPTSTETARYPNLETAIAYHGSGRWAPETLAAARAMRLDADSDPAPTWWTKKLDALEVAIYGATIGDPLEGDAVADAKPTGRARKNRS